MQVCMDGQHPDVNFQCHKTLGEVMQTNSGYALPSEIKTLVRNLAKDRYNFKAVGASVEPVASQTQRR